MPSLSPNGSGTSSARRRLADAPAPPPPKTNDTLSTEPNLVREAQRLQGMLGGSRLQPRAAVEERSTSNESPRDIPAEQQPSVLDASNMSKPLPSGNPYDESDATTEQKRAVSFLQEQQNSQARLKQFSGSSDSDVDQQPSDQAPAEQGFSRDIPQRRTPQERSAQFIQQQQQAQLGDERLRRALERAEGVKQGQFFSPLVGGVSPQQFKDTIVRVNRVLAAKSGIGLGWALFSSNMLLVNKVFNSSLLPGYKSPQEKAARPGMQFTDLVDVGIALITNLIAVVYLLPVIGMLAAIFLVAAVLVLGAAYLGPVLGDLVFQLLH